MRPLCECGNLCKFNGISKRDGRQLYQTICGSCDKKKYGDGRPRGKNKKVKGDVCSKCGFVPLHPCQLDVDHIDGNGENYSPDNIQTLCANCHRYKTFLNSDWYNKRSQKIPGV